MAVAIGISNCMSTTSLSAITARTSAESTLRCALAPGATTMVFSAAASTVIDRRCRSGPAALTDAVQPDVVGAQMGAQLLGGGVGPSAATS